MSSILFYLSLFLSFFLLFVGSDPPRSAGASFVCFLYPACLPCHVISYHVLNLETVSKRKTRIFGIIISPGREDQKVLTSPSHSPAVEFCGYTIPHPSESKMNLRIQTYGKSFINLTPDPRGLDPYPILSHPILFHPTNLFQFSRLARQGSLLTDLTQTKLQTVRRPSKRSRRASTT